MTTPTPQELCPHWEHEHVYTSEEGPHCANCGKPLPQHTFSGHCAAFFIPNRRIVKREPYKSCTECTFGYCAPNRCYCGHEECNAYHSYVDPYKEPIKTQGIDASHHKKSWRSEERRVGKECRTGSPKNASE